MIRVSTHHHLKEPPVAKPKDNKCRDCSFCTESLAASLVKAPLRIAISPLRGLSWMFKRKCPKCGHPLSNHSRDKDGRFKD